MKENLIKCKWTLHYIMKRPFKIIQNLMAFNYIDLIKLFQIYKEQWEMFENSEGK